MVDRAEIGRRPIFGVKRPPEAAAVTVGAGISSGPRAPQARRTVGPAAVDFPCSTMYRKAAIRPYRPVDEPVLFGLARSAFGEAPGWAPRRTFEALEHDVVFVAEVDGRPAGYEALACARTAVRIEQLLVSADHDGEGIEDQLVDYAEGYAITLGVRTLEVVVEPDNAVARSLYRGHGFARATDDVLRLVLPQR